VLAQKQEKASAASCEEYFLPPSYAAPILKNCPTREQPGKKEAFMQAFKSINENLPSSSLVLPEEAKDI
jgi:hypothetical protein